MSLPEIDLKPFGINLQLKSSYMTLTPYLTPDRLNKAAATGDSISVGGVLYKRGSKLGAGSYGATYICTDSKGNSVAIKEIHDSLINLLDFQNFLKEIIIQIILVNISEGEPFGPYVPRIYAVGYDPQTRRGYIVSELMRGTLGSLISKFSESDNDIVIPSALNQIAHILEFFGKKVAFNHRDCKDDNIMYVRDGPRRLFKLIDFGFSCLKWNNLQISGGNIFTPSSSCFKRERDLGQLLYNIRKYTPHISPELKEWLNNTLVAEVGKEKCAITEGCEIHGKKIVQGWKNTYEFFDRTNVRPLYAGPSNLIRKLGYLQEKKGFYTPKAVPEPRRSITRNSQKTGIRLCPSGQIRNPKTRRCVKITGSVGKEAAKESGIPLAALKPLPEQEKNCPSGKIFNPATGRCVKMDGAVGKLLQKAM